MLAELERGRAAVEAGDCAEVASRPSRSPPAVDELCPRTAVDPEIGGPARRAPGSLDELASTSSECESEPTTTTTRRGRDHRATTEPTTTEETTTGDDDHDRDRARSRRRADDGDDGGLPPGQPPSPPTDGGTAGGTGRRRRGRRALVADGTLISERYELGDRLGSGGMSNVYRATDRILERTVAVKILAEHLSDDESFVARFRREALAVAKLIHPNIVQVYDTGVDEGRHYIVMEYVEGRSGAQILQRQAPSSPRTDGRDRGPGLRRARLRPPPGIIHRDVKPGNLMVIGGPRQRRRAAEVR